MTVELDHIGIAVETLEQGKKFYELLGFQHMDVEEVSSEKVRVGFLGLGNRANLELLEPRLADDGQLDLLREVKDE